MISLGTLIIPDVYTVVIRSVSIAVLYTWLGYLWLYMARLLLLFLFSYFNRKKIPYSIKRQSKGFDIIYVAC